MNLIELHILQSFPVTCLNRDDVGAPKTAMFGGCTRSRVSSQSWKRAIRSLAKEAKQELFAGQRTRFLVRSLETAYTERGLEEKQAKALAAKTADSLGKLDDIEKGNVKTLLYFSPQEMANIANAMLETEYAVLLASIADESTTKAAKEKAEKDLKKLTEKAVKAMKNKVKDNADIAIFGRMVADDHSLMVEGAGLFSHAISTHSTANEIDFFSAVDDNNTLGDEGAGHIGTLEYSSACYYRYVGLNLDMLKDDDHLAHFSEQEQQDVIAAFLKAAIMAVPTARKNSMFGYNPPACILGLNRTGQPLSLVNAFEAPIYNKQGYIGKSIEAMKAHWNTLAETYCLKDDVNAVAHMQAMNQKNDENSEAHVGVMNLNDFIAELLKGKQS